MNQSFVDRIEKEIEDIRQAGLFKQERIIASEQGAEILVNGKKVLNFCANNYLGLSSHPRVIEAAHKTIDSRGFGMSSVRFICGTQDTQGIGRKIVTFFRYGRYHFICGCF
jgi:glycine C-acetyltransferase